MTTTTPAPEALPEPFAYYCPKTGKLMSVHDYERGAYIEGPMRGNYEPVIFQSEARAALASRDAELAKLRGWRDAVDEALVTAHVGVATEPYDDLNKLLQWHHDIWLDPAVSSDAEALVEQGRAQAAKLRQGEPLAWCALTPSGKIAYFDGEPMVMVGPVGNEHHTTALVAAQPPREPVQPLSDVNWMPFGLTVAAALDRGDDARMLFDENSPLRDELRRLIQVERKRQ